jgi:hypothetical protein
VILSNTLNRCTLQPWAKGAPFDPTRPLFDLDKSSWSKTWKAELTGNNLSKDLCIVELERRWEHKLIYEARKQPLVTVPMPKQWRNPRILDDLQKFPIDSPVDLLHILSMYSAKKERSDMVLQVRRMTTGKKVLPKKKNWNGRLPLLRLIHCIIDFEDIKKLYSKRHVAASKKRMAMDNRKSEGKHPPSVWELVADKWNDPLYTTTTEIVLRARKNEYDNPIVITHNTVERFMDATAAKCKKKFREIVLGVIRADNSWKKVVLATVGLSSSR